MGGAAGDHEKKQNHRLKLKTKDDKMKRLSYKVSKKGLFTLFAALGVTATAVACYVGTSRECPATVRVARGICDLDSGSIPFVAWQSGHGGYSDALDDGIKHCHYILRADPTFVCGDFYTGSYVSGVACP